MAAIGIRIGTRSSALAMWQANRVREELEALGVSVEIVPIKTSGDKNRSGPIANIGAQGAFTREIQTALLENRIDLAVHSLKDLPTEPVPGLWFAATLDREDVRDVFVSSRFAGLDELPDGARLGTGSLRRRCQVVHRLGGRAVAVEDIRGNVETRLKKMDSGEYDAVVLAVAGLVRLGLGARAPETARLDPREFLPAVGQGALGLETRMDDEKTNGILRRLNRVANYLAVVAERRMLMELKGGCIAPIGALTEWRGARLVLRGRVLSLDGSEQYDAVAEADFSGMGIPVCGTNVSKGAGGELPAGAVAKAEELGRNAADALVARGAGVVMEEIQTARWGHGIGGGGSGRDGTEA